MPSKRLEVNTIQSLAFGSIDVAYMGIGPAFDESARFIVVANLTDRMLFFSYDGVNDHFLIPVQSSLVLTIMLNRDEYEDYLAVPAGNRLYVRYPGTPPNLGAAYVTQFRGINDA